MIASVKTYLMSGNESDMRKHLPGIRSSTKKLAGGGKRTLLLCMEKWPTFDGPRRHTARTCRSPLLHGMHRRARPKLPQQGTLFNLIALFRGSTEFNVWPIKTTKSYSRYLKLIENEYGDMPLAVVERPKARGEFKAWRDKFAATPRTADLIWTILARVLSVAKDRA